MSEYFTMALVFLIGILIERRFEVTIRIEQALINLYKKYKTKEKK